MQATHVLMLQSDPRVAQTLSDSLSHSFHAVHIARSLDEVRRAAAKFRPDAIILDLESATLEQLEELKREFASVRIICNHRVADEEMWTRSLTAGADDFCPSDDVRSILTAVTPTAPNVRAMVA
jgi:DNA-binding response OmpR family regulator